MRVWQYVDAGLSDIRQEVKHGNRSVNEYVRPLQMNTSLILFLFSGFLQNFITMTGASTTVHPRLILFLRLLVKTISIATKRDLCLLRHNILPMQLPCNIIQLGCLPFRMLRVFQREGMLDSFQYCISFLCYRTTNKSGLFI